MVLHFFHLFSITMNFATDTVSIQYISLHSTSCIVQKKGQKYFQLRTIRQVWLLHGFKGRDRLILRSRLNEAKKLLEKLIQKSSSDQLLELYEQIGQEYGNTCFICPMCTNDERMSHMHCPICIRKQLVVQKLWDTLYVDWHPTVIMFWGLISLYARNIPVHSWNAG